MSIELISQKGNQGFCYCSPSNNFALVVVRTVLVPRYKEPVKMEDSPSLCTERVTLLLTPTLFPLALALIHRLSLCRVPFALLTPVR